jgi:heme A synthase
MGALGAALVGMLVLGASGGITALGDTLNLTAGITPEESPLVATLTELRIFHPILAFAVGGLILLAVWAARALRPSPTVYRLGWLLGGIYCAQLLVGAVNVVLKAPVAMQLIHLFISDMIWIALILLAANALATNPATVPIGDSQSRATSLTERTV